MKLSVRATNTNIGVRKFAAMFVTYSMVPKCSPVSCFKKKMLLKSQRKIHKAQVGRLLAARD